MALMVMRSSVARGMLATLPLLPPTLLWGAAFGAAAASRGLAPAGSLAMSGFVWSGTAQMGVLTLMGGPLPVIFLTSLLLSLRFVPMSLSLGQLLDEPSRWRRALAGCLLADAGFALLARLGRARPAYLLGTWATQWAAWVLGTALGTLASPLLPAGVLASASDALVAAIFGVLAVQACSDRRQGLVAVAAGAAAVGASWALAVR
jgi:predicted branched-subunit amino acid permease